MKKRKAASWSGILPGAAAVAASTHAAIPHISPSTSLSSATANNTQSDTSETHEPHIPRVDPHKLVEADLHDLVKDIRNVSVIFISTCEYE